MHMSGNFPDSYADHRRILLERAGRINTSGEHAGLRKIQGTDIFRLFFTISDTQIKSMNLLLLR